MRNCRQKCHIRLVYDLVWGKTGVRDVWIPILTVLGLGHEEGTGDKRRGIRCNFTTSLEDSDFADDVALLSSTFNDLQEKTGRLAEDAARVGLRLNARKCSEGGGSKDIIHCLQRARGAFQRLRRVWAARGIGRRTKMRLFN